MYATATKLAKEEALSEDDDSPYGGKVTPKKDPTKSGSTYNPADIHTQKKNDDLSGFKGEIKKVPTKSGRLSFGNYQVSSARKGKTVDVQRANVAPGGS